MADTESTENSPGSADEDMEVCRTAIGGEITIGARNTARDTAHDVVTHAASRGILGSRHS